MHDERGMLCSGLKIEREVGRRESKMRKLQKRKQNKILQTSVQSIINIVVFTKVGLNFHYRRCGTIAPEKEFYLNGKSNFMDWKQDELKSLRRQEYEKSELQSD